MAYCRVETADGYTVMSNYHLRDMRLSLKARGLLSQILSLPEKWDMTISGLSKINRECSDTMLWIFAAERKSLISSLLARCSSVSFLRLLLIIKTSEVVSLLLYTTSEVYTNFWIDSWRRHSDLSLWWSAKQWSVSAS